MSPERQPLLSPSSSSTSAVREEQVGCSKKWHICQLSKAAIALIVFNAVVGASYVAGMNFAMWVGYTNGTVSVIVIGVYLFFAIVTILSPLSGFLADVYCGRYRIVHTGLGLMLGALIIISFSAVLTMIYGFATWKSFTLKPFFAMLIAIIYLIFVIGHVSYQANFIQFGLDQLLEAPSTALALFIHWIVWADSLGNFIIQGYIALLMCRKEYVRFVGCSLPLVLMFCFILMVVCLRRRWFYSEPGHANPYKMVVKVLSFARCHKYPLQRSAFTYTGDEKPSRLDFGKERYGGPFTTEQVEDVKTFLRILAVLLVIGLLFFLEIPSSIFGSIIFGLHAGDHSAIIKQVCSVRFIFLDKGSMINLITVLVFPVYLKLVYPHVRKIFSRLIIAGAIYLLGVAGMLCIDLAGHITTMGETTGNVSMCMFTIAHGIAPPELHLQSELLFLPDTLLGIGQPLIMATSFEFISAQSPSSMKGLLLGVFFTIRAIFQLISGIALIPFSYNPLWDSPYMKEHPPVTNCGFGYLLFICVVALIGLVLLSVVARRYKYRERDDRPYDQRFVVDVYSRYLE